MAQSQDLDIDDLQLAGALVRQSGDLAAAMLAQGLQTHHKSSVSDVVSAADHAAEMLVVERLRQARPADGLIGEEGTNHPTRSGRTWFIDPVDGTYNFLSGLSSWCSAIGVTDEGGLRIGAVYQPAANELWLGGSEIGTTCNGSPVLALTEAPLARLSIASYLHPATLPDADLREPLLAAMSHAATVRMLGSGSVELAAVAAGRLGAWLQHDSLDWDWYPGAALVHGAGGTTDVFVHRGHRWHVAGNRLVVQQLREIVLAS